MTKYLISFPSAAMIVPDEELPAVSDAAHAVVEEAKAAGVWVFGGGIDDNVPPVLVGEDGIVTEGTYPQTKQLEGGYAVFELPSPEAAGMGGETRDCLPMRARGAGVRVRPRQLDADRADHRQVPIPDTYSAYGVASCQSRSFAPRQSLTTAGSTVSAAAPAALPSSFTRLKTARTSSSSQKSSSGMELAPPEWRGR